MTHSASRIVTGDFATKPATANAIAILTGIVVNFYNEILEARRKETLSAFLDRLEKLSELSHEELVELSKRVHQFRLKKK